MPSENPRLTVIVLTLNEENNLPDCIRSLRGIDCALMIVDSGSTDATVAIAKAAGAHVEIHAFENYGAQRNWAQENLPIQSAWVLHLDADERLTPELAAEIEATLSDPSDDCDGYLLCRRTVFMGRWIRHGGHYPSYHLRLFRRAKGNCENRLYDQHFMVNGKVRKLKNDYTDIVAPNLERWSTRHVRWAGLEADEALLPQEAKSRRVRPKLMGSPIEGKRWLRDSVYGRAPLFARAFGYWIYRYFVRFGFLDGVEGLIFHFLQGCWYRFLIDAKLYERRKGGQQIGL